MTENKLTLDQEKHIYRYENRKVSNVTSILQDNFGIQPYWTDFHREKGRAIHHAIHLYVKNELDWATVDNRIRGRLKAFQRFMSETGYQIIKSEMPLFSKRYQFAGTLDLWVQELDTLQSPNIIIDIKPPSPEPIVNLQLAAYSLVLQEHTGLKINKAAAVCLKDNGHYSLKWVPMLKHAQRVFLACLTVSNWQKENQ